MAQVNLYLVALGTITTIFGSHLEKLSHESNMIKLNGRKYIPYEATPLEFVGRILEMVGLIFMSHSSSGF